MSSHQPSKREEALRRLLQDEPAGSSLGRRFFSLEQEKYVFVIPEVAAETDYTPPSSAINPLFW
jgi:hypothetical protein